MSTDIVHLAARIGDLLGPDSANMPPWLWRPLLHLLALGEPVTVDDLAAATGRTADEARHGLAGLAHTEYDELGRVIGHGITLRPTPHRFTADGRELWCALDTLTFPAVIGHSARVESPCHGTGVPVHPTVEPDKVTNATRPPPSYPSSPRTRTTRSVPPSATRSTSSPHPPPPNPGSTNTPKP